METIYLISLLLIGAHPLTLRGAAYPGYLIRNQTKDHIRDGRFDSIIRNSEFISESGWKPIFNPYLKNTATNSRSLKLNSNNQRIPNFNYIRGNNLGFHSNNLTNQRINTLHTTLKPDVERSYAIQEHHFNVSKKIHNESSRNNTEKDSIIVETLHKILEKFEMRFNAILESARKEAVQNRGIHHSSGQSNEESHAEAGYRGDPRANSTRISGTLHYHGEEGATEPNREVHGKPGVTETPPIVRSDHKFKNKRRSPGIQIADLNVFDWSRNTSNSTSPNSLNQLSSSSNRVAKSVYPRVPFLIERGYNSPEHSPPDPYVALFLSHYGRYLPTGGFGYRNLYSYLASNNIHNNKPFGSYKIYEETDA